MSTSQAASTIPADLGILRRDPVLQQEVDEVRDIVRLCLLVSQRVKHNDAKLIPWRNHVVHDDFLRLLQ